MPFNFFVRYCFRELHRVWEKHFKPWFYIIDSFTVHRVYFWNSFRNSKKNKKWVTKNWFLIHLRSSRMCKMFTDLNFHTFLIPWFQRTEYFCNTILKEHSSLLIDVLVNLFKNFRNTCLFSLTSCLSVVAIIMICLSYIKNFY